MIEPNSMPPLLICISCVPTRAREAKRLAQKLNIPLVTAHQPDTPFHLHLNTNAIELIDCHQPFNPISVDFCQGKNYHRYRFSNNKNQLIAKACGLKSHTHPQVLDTTGGLGSDAFALACLGCHVTILERNPILATLLEDGLMRAKQHSELKQLHLTLINTDATKYLADCTTPDFDVIYLDPMYPHRQKSSLVKKEMRVIRALVGADIDSEQLLPLATAKAKRRTVVKRPLLAEHLGGHKPSLQYKGRRSRFDIYLPVDAPTK